MRKPFYQDKWVTIYHGDCREVLPELPKADLVLTDPPYGIDKADWDVEFTMPPEDIKTDIMGLMPGVWNLLKVPQKIQAYDKWLKFRWQIIAHLVNGMTHGAIGRM